MTKHKYFLLMVLLCNVMTATCMSRCNRVEINGKKASLFGHLRQLNRDKNHLKNIELIRLEYVCNKIIYKVVAINGNISNISKNDRSHIKNENYIFVPYYRLDSLGSDYKETEIGAFILGTRNKKHKNNLTTAYLIHLRNSGIKKSYKSKRKRKFDGVLSTGIKKRVIR